MWVFDNMVPVWLTTKQLKFFEKPLEQGDLVQALTVESSSVTISTDILYFEFAKTRVKDMYELYGVSKGYLYYYAF